MRPPLDESYFTWLYSQVGSVEVDDPRKTYWDILRILYTKEFVWIIPNDDNRAEDGQDLRRAFLDESGQANEEPAWQELGCSVLELLIALSQRLSFQTDKPASEWFWVLIRNLGLKVYNDSRKIPAERIDDKLDSFIWRTYRQDGYGGLFPLESPAEDQRDVELWYQMSAYLLEKGYY